MYRRERRPRRSGRRKAEVRYDVRTNLPIEVKFVRRNAGDGVPYAGECYLLQSRTTLPDMPEFMASKPFWKSV